MYDVHIEVESLVYIIIICIYVGSRTIFFPVCMMCIVVKYRDNNLPVDFFRLV